MNKSRKDNSKRIGIVVTLLIALVLLIIGIKVHSRFDNKTEDVLMSKIIIDSPEPKETSEPTIIKETILVDPLTPIKKDKVEATNIPHVSKSIQKKQTIQKQKHNKRKKSQKPKRTYLDVDVPLNKELKTYIYNKCDKNDELYCLILAIIQCESSFVADTVSADGHDFGYMQIRDCNLPRMRKVLGVTNLTDPKQNIACGIHIIRGYIKKYNNYRVSLMAYNFGEGGARRKWRQGIYTSNYAEKVISYKNKFYNEIYN